MPALRGNVPWHTQQQFPQFTPEAYWRIFGKSPIFGNPEKAQGYYDSIIQSAQSAGLAPAFLAAVIAQETGSGTSNAFKSYNNPGGLMSGNRHLTFDTLEEGILSTAQNLHNNVARAIERFGGGESFAVGDVQKIWAPIGAANDQRGLNKDWEPGVNKFLQGIGNLGLPWADQANNNPTGWNPVIGLGGPEKLSTALHQGTGGEFWIDPNAIRSQPGVLSPMLGSFLQQQGILPLDWGWDPTSNTWQNAPGAGSNWVLEQVPSVAGGPALQMWDVPGAGIQYGPPDPLAGVDVWPILQGGGGANVATGGIDLANAAARWFGGVSHQATGGTVWDASTGGTYWDASPNAGGGTVWDATPGHSVLQQIWDPTLENAPGAPPGGLRTWDASLLNAPGVVSPELGGYLQSMNVFSPNMGYNPVNNVWQEAPPAPGWSLTNLNQLNPLAQSTLLQQFQQYYPTTDFTNLFEGVGDSWSGPAVMGWTPPPPSQAYGGGGAGGWEDFGPGTGGFNMGSGNAAVTMTLADIQSGAGNPLFAGTLWSGVNQGPQQNAAAIDALQQQMHNQAMAQVATFNQQQAAHNAAALAAAATSGQGVTFGVPLVNPTNPLGIWGLG